MSSLNYKVYKNLRPIFIAWTIMSFVLVIVMTNTPQFTEIAFVFNAVALFILSYFIPYKYRGILLILQFLSYLVLLFIFDQLISFDILSAGLLPILILECSLLLKKSKYWVISLFVLTISIIANDYINSNLFHSFMLLQAFFFSGFFLFVMYHYQKKQYFLIKELRNVNMKLRDANQKIETLSRKNERSIITEELHDGMLQDLIGIRMQLEVLNNRFENLDKEEVKLAIHNLVELSSKMITSSRDTLQGVVNIEKVDTNLFELVQKICHNFEIKYNLVTRLQFSSKEVILAGKTALILQKVINEGFQNIQKHSKSSTVLVKQTGLMLEIIDFGIGFDRQKVKTSGHFGLISMERRLNELGGSLKIDSKMNEGTRVIITWEDINKNEFNDN
ncbi:MAG: histidine kinase [Lactococcus chungangensis]